MAVILCFMVLLLRFGVTVRSLQHLRRAATLSRRAKRTCTGSRQSEDQAPLAAAMAQSGGREAWLRERAIFLVGRFRDASSRGQYSTWAPWWQVVIWARQLTLLLWARLSRSQLQTRVSESDSAWPLVWAWSSPALLVLFIVWCAHRAVQPFAYSYQNAMESWLLGSSMLLVLLACAYSALVDQVHGAGELSDELARAAGQLSNSSLSAQLLETSASLQNTFDVIVMALLLFGLVLPGIYIMHDCCTFQRTERPVSASVISVQRRVRDDEMARLRLRLEAEREERRRVRRETTLQHRQQQQLEVELVVLREQLEQQPARAISSVELAAATDDFSDMHKLGEGGFGVIYRAASLPTLPGTPGCAIKCLAPEGPLGKHGLLNELQVLGVCRHEYLLPLLGYCLEGSMRCLVFPLMAGGCLEDRLIPSADGERRLRKLGFEGQPPPLTWQQRVRIIRDAMRALLYLHFPSGNRSALLHRDVKPANILLDDRGNGRLADFGLARTAPGSQRSHQHTGTLAGTTGYLDPLFMEGGKYSEITDGYAMGISLLVCLTGRPAIGLVESCADALENPGGAPSVADAAAAWPADVACDILSMVVGLSWVRVSSRRTSLAAALDQLEVLSDRVGVRPGLAEEGLPLVARRCVICMAEPRAVRFTCGHACCCATCAEQLLLRSGNERRCPTCRVPIRGTTDAGEHVAFENTFDAGHIDRVLGGVVHRL
eukprot:CAMPEP_0181237446 /NCGR_PEP_ID=MMETSP1096-20121128/38764_1 /TAXON_ID=156174 ORGANISM="Chrysochromulina ericina, Strain CCMP281" /NCGR_SAMPLE_ID=MMETSP1096 /ASSEMBLY_ACC=CAM_ASM_000453 /LENGTH=715 /DNA_ID=CAMNT_0023332795 /DNA_START=24 /DNA_END=2171 /DNA_ORIENTATION=+